MKANLVLKREKRTKESILYNVWRGFRFTIKGKKAGCSEQWKIFENFEKNMALSYFKEAKLCRIDKKKPFSEDNCKWVTVEELANSKLCTIQFAYNNVIKPLYLWAKELELNLNGVKIRYHHKYVKELCTAEEVLFGIKKRNKRELLNAADLEMQQLKNKASKMISAYKCKDKKRNMICDLDTPWLIENILFKSCSYCGETRCIGCDRINNSIGHLKNNVIPCCMRCNTVRLDSFNVEEMKLIGQTIKLIVQKRKESNKILLQ